MWELNSANWYLIGLLRKLAILIHLKIPIKNSSRWAPLYYQSQGLRERKRRKNCRSKSRINKISNSNLMILLRIIRMSQIPISTEIRICWHNFNTTLTHREIIIIISLKLCSTRMMLKIIITKMIITMIFNQVYRLISKTIQK